MKKGFLFFCFCFFILLLGLRGEFFMTETFVVTIYLLISSIGSRYFGIRVDFLLSSQNIAFAVFFFRLYIIPCMAIFEGYPGVGGYNEDISDEFMLQGYLIILFMYISFIIGWHLYFLRRNSNTIRSLVLTPKIILYICGVFLFFGICSLAFYFPSIKSYFLNIFLTSERVEKSIAAKLLEVSANMARFFLPFVVFGIVSLIHFEGKSRIFIYSVVIIASIFIILFSLNANRQSMIYPVLALWAGFIPRLIQIKLIPTLIAGVIILYFLFAFGNIRSSENVDIKDSKLNRSEIVQLVEVYAGGAHMVTPVLKMDSYENTIFNSFFYSFPILGKSLREDSGLELYNSLYFGYKGRTDQVFHTQSECYLNGGYLLVFVFFVIVGYIYSFLNEYYIYSRHSQLLYQITVYYVILLFNASILLSFQVLGQFLFFNMVPALIILYIYYLFTNKKR